MKTLYSISAYWRRRDIEFLNSIGLNNVEEGIDIFSVEEGTIYDKITTHFSKKNPFFNKTKPKEFRIIPATVTFSKEELEAAKSYTASLGIGKLEDYWWNDSTQWKRELYNNKCDTCSLPKGEQIKPWVLRRDFKQLEKHPFVSFEGLGGYLFCSKELAKRIKKEFGIDHMKVLIGKKERVSENLVQLKIPLAPYKLLLDGTPYGYTNNDKGEIIKDKILCSECKEPTYINQTLDFFPPFEKDFDFDLVLTQEWFGWYRRIVFSRRFLNFCFEHKILKNLETASIGGLIPQR